MVRPACWKVVPGHARALTRIRGGRQGSIRWRMLDNSPTAGEFLKLLALAERLGWLAVVLPLNHIEVKEEHSNVFNLEFEQALNQASGLLRFARNDGLFDLCRASLAGLLRVVAARPMRHHRNPVSEPTTVYTS